MNENSDMNFLKVMEKMNNRKQLYVMTSFIIIILCLHQPLWAETLDDMKVIKISPKDGKAVVKFIHQKELEIIKVGDIITDGARIIEIAKGRVVMEKTNDLGMELIVIRLENGKQWTERISKTATDKPADNIKNITTSTSTSD